MTSRVAQHAGSTVLSSPTLLLARGASFQLQLAPGHNGSRLTPLGPAANLQ